MVWSHDPHAPVGVIADDLTGANATGILIRRLGLRTVSLIGLKGSPRNLGEYDCICLNTESRALPPQEAYSQVFAAAHLLLENGARLLAKRIDSTLRGNLGAELEAVLAVIGGEALAVVSGAVPASGRTTVAGRHYIDGLLLAETAVLHDPLCPVSESHVPTLLASQSNLRIGRIGLRPVRRGPAAVAQALRRLAKSGVRLVCVDAETDQDLLHIGKGMAASRLTCLAADPGPLTAAYVGALPRMPGKAILPAAGPRSHGHRALVLCGSTTPLSNKQLNRLVSQLGATLVAPDPTALAEGGGLAAGEIARLVSELTAIPAEQPVLGLRAGPLLANADPAAAGRIATSFAAAGALTLQAMSEIAGLYTSGGDVTLAVCQALGAEGISLESEVLPLGVAGRLVGGGHHGLRIVTKGGLVGGRDAATLCVNAILKEADSISKRPCIGITLGDPASIGPEITVKALGNPQIYQICRPVLIGDARVVARALAATELDLTVNPIDHPAQGRYTHGTIDLIDLANVQIENLVWGEVQAQAGQASFEYVKRSIQLAMAHEIDAVATAPINKEALKAAGVPFIGHTEIYGELTGSPEPLTMFETRGLRIFFLTRHLSLASACTQVTRERTLTTLHRCQAALTRLGVAAPRIAVAGLNPHAGEHGLFGNEEVRELAPAVADARAQGLDVHGPLPADSVFWHAAQGRFDAVLSLFHDQGHIAAKMYDFHRTISITNGLPFLRSSVDHGTALDIAGQNKASAVSMEEAIKAAARYAAAFRQ